MTCYSFTPGVILTEQGVPAARCFDPLFKAISRDEWTGSQTTLYCALQENIEDESGSLFDNCHTHVLPKLAIRDDVVRDFYEATPRVVPKRFLKLCFVTKLHVCDYVVYYLDHPPETARHNID